MFHFSVAKLVCYYEQIKSTFLLKNIQLNNAINTFRIYFSVLNYYANDIFKDKKITQMKSKWIIFRNVLTSKNKFNKHYQNNKQII